ncbi:TetR/AcrR family transcriptional regulator [Chromohalobacter sp. 296-RDG]|uniref:TetR/AcrR family transcriptional regulator n=1 Tax=Chromohalobacter sp. 296-RDG TaxID=2994062 RepID=UPI002469BFAA|nr:TetR/AcrR family transcriptional regulator [Chromohalobacter sp. 296-RDG]
MARPQAFDTQEALHCAMHVFWRKGYEATSLSDLLQATGLSKSSLYATFGSKHDLMLKAFDKYRTDRQLDMSRMLDVTPARPGIEAFFRMIVEDVRSPEQGSGCMSINQAVELAPHDTEIRCRIESDFQAIEQALAHAIDRGQADGSVTAKCPPADLAKLMVVAFPGLQVLTRSGIERLRVDEGLALVLALLD